MEAAAQLFNEEGITNTSIESITDRAGIAKGTFYLHFGSKDQVVAKLWEQYLEGFVSIAGERLDAPVSGEADWRQFISELLEQLIVMRSGTPNCTVRSTGQPTRRRWICAGK